MRIKKINIEQLVCVDNYFFVLFCPCMFEFGCGVLSHSLYRVVARMMLASYVSVSDRLVAFS